MEVLGILTGVRHESLHLARWCWHSGHAFSREPSHQTGINDVWDRLSRAFPGMVARNQYKSDGGLILSASQVPHSGSHVPMRAPGSLMEAKSPGCRKN